MSDMDERLKRLIARRNEAATERERLLSQRKAILSLAEEEAREDLSTEEDTEFRRITAEVKAKDEAITGYDERIAELSDEIEREGQVSEGAAALRRAQARVAVISESVTYAQGNGRSYMQDMLRHSLRMDADGEAEARLRRHAEEVRNGTEYRDLNRTDGTGGYFVPPAWLMAQFIELARAGRAVANLAPSQALPGGTDSINIPKIATGTSTGVQTADNAAVSETDLTDTSVVAPVRTIAGQQDVAIQLLDQSPVNFDEVIFRDLVADYSNKLNAQVIGGSGSSGQMLGIRGTANIITITQSTATVAATYSAIADGVQRVHTQRFLPPTVIVMHPRRWAYFLAAVDTTGRPLVVPNATGTNSLATLGAVAAEQVVGSMHGLPVVTDPGLPTTLGTGTNEDVIWVMRAADLLLFESSIRTRVLPEVGSGTLTTRLQVYGYAAFTAGRQPKGIVEIGGAGLVAPTF